MKKKYVDPEIEISSLEKFDIITTSNPILESGPEAGIEDDILGME